MLHKIQSLWRFLKQKTRIRRELPVELESQFEEYKDIRSIDRLQVAAWIGVFFTLCLFFLDYSRKQSGLMDKEHYYVTLFYIHTIGLLFFIPAFHITLNKKWIVKTQIRRGVVIWGMVVLVFSFLLSQAVVVYINRGTTTVYMGFVFIATWMFAMSHKERTIFFTVTIALMLYAIHLRFQSLRDPDLAAVGLIEIGFLSVVAFFIDSFDYNMRVTNFLYQIQIETEQKRVKQLEEFKSKFFTNITHEFRTPLTLILGMSREIADDPDRWSKEGTQMITENAGNLLNLVNQILDLSKVEASALPVNLVQGDIVSYVGYIIDSFRGNAMQKAIELHYLCKEDEVIMDYDPIQFATIITNLLSNAVKFSSENDNVYLSLSLHQEGLKEFIEITVQDNGVGIPKDELNRIFERFYQVPSTQSMARMGTGVGLSLTKELVELFHGEIYATSTIGKGSQFKVKLPVSRNAPMAEPTLHADGRISLPKGQSFSGFSKEMDGEEDQSLGKPELLIIDDHPDVIKYLRICLQDLYKLSFAKNGEEGINQAIKIVPDLIISDVLMPIKDGLTVCRELSHNPVTSHIPIILLSAKTDANSRVAGLESGADVYMLKPFDKDELRAQIRSLLDRFDELHQRYANPEQIPAVSQEEPLVIEDEFITKVRNIVHKHLDDAEFAVHDIERGVFLSRSQLHKKLKALTGLSAMQFVNRIRLNSAREKLRSGKASITDIAYQVGYSDPNYFSRAYSEEFGESPSETRNSLKNNMI